MKWFRLRGRTNWNEKLADARRINLEIDAVARRIGAWKRRGERKNITPEEMQFVLLEGSRIIESIKDLTARVCGKVVKE